MNMESLPTSDVVIVHGNSHPELANLIAGRLGVKSGGASVYHKTNRETMVEIGDSIRGKDIYIIQTGTKYAKFPFFFVYCVHAIYWRIKFA